MEEIIRVENLTHTYGEGTPFCRSAVQDMSLAIYRGEFLGIIGHTGSGKSTLIQHLNGLLKPTSGRILLGGEDIWADPKKIRNVRFRVGLVFQYPEYQLFEETVYRDIAFGPTNMGLSKDEIDRRVRESAHFAGLTDDLLEKSPFALSGGQKRRVAIAGVIAMEPEVLVLDEPTAGLDPKERVRFRNLISALAQDKVVILSTHIVSDVEYIADEILIMRAGQIVASGTIEEILAQVSGVVWECAVTPREADVMSARMAVGNVRYDHSGMAIVRIVSDTAPHSSARLVEPTLEDVYLYIFQEGSERHGDGSSDSRDPYLRNER